MLKIRKWRMKKGEGAGAPPAAGVVLPAGKDKSVPND